MSSVTDELELFSDPAVLDPFHPLVRDWFLETFAAPTRAQAKAWPAIAAGENTLLLAPTGSGKTLAAFLVAIDRLIAARAGGSSDAEPGGVRVLYLSPLKALGVDVERNLRAPLAGVRNLAERRGIDLAIPSVAVRSGDTPSNERRRLAREPADILITTPESLYLLLTSQARSILQTVETVIVDEIHSVVATKRGAHLMVSLERLEELRRAAGLPAVQRIGLSATQRPLDEVARLLGGGEWQTISSKPRLVPRPVTIVDASYSKRFDIRIEVPVEDMANLGQTDEIPSGPTAGGPAPASIWPAIHPRLVQLIRSHRSTILFTNSRRLAERLAAAINELADEQLALAHHGSIAKDTRVLIEDRLKRGDLRAIVATSSLELGIDMGAVDLVIQIESPPSIAAGVQRIGRAGHHVGETSSGVVLPKYRGDLLACTAAVERMKQGLVEETHYPRNPLDVLAQQIVAMVALEPQSVDTLYATICRAAPFHELPRSAFEGVLDLLAGRYPSDEFAELRPRVNWDRIGGIVSVRQGAQRLAILNAGTIPDRGLYGVYLADGAAAPSRVGELDEEMVFETHPGDVFLLGASSWRVVEITHDRVLVVPAPGEPGRMPFWRGEGPGRPREFGAAIGALARRLVRLDADEARRQLTEDFGLDRRAAFNLLKYLREQVEATGELPSDRALVVECFLDEVGDWRVVILSPFGTRVHAPWAMAVSGRWRREMPGEIDVIWADDGIVLRLPASDEPPPLDELFPRSDEIEEMVTRELGSTALFAARFRENAARALLLPKQHAAKRMPLWVQRKRSADLLGVAARYPSFPLLLETYRECLRDVFDLPGLKELLRDVEQRKIRVKQVMSESPSPFAASLLFGYTGNFIYDGDAPLAERRAATLALDHAQLRELLGDAELRELLDADAIETTALELQRLTERSRVRHADGLHELLLFLGDLRIDEIQVRTDPEALAGGQLERWLDELVSQRRVIAVRIAGEQRYVAAEDAGRVRDALGVAPPPGLPAAFLESVADPVGDLVSRFARTHGPFRIEQVAERLGIGMAVARAALERLAERHRVLEGEFLPGGRGREWCDAEVLRMIKRRSLARLRQQIEPVAATELARFLPHWHGLHQPRRGLDGLLDAIEQLQGAPLALSALERWILPARVVGYQPSDLDELCAAGEVVWRGFDPITGGDGRIALYLTDHFAALAPPPGEAEGELAARIRELLSARGASFFDDIVRQIGGFPQEVLDSLWELVWAGEATNDTLAPLRSLSRKARRANARRSRAGRAFRSRRLQRLPGTEGRWSLLYPAFEINSTQRLAAQAGQLIERYGILTRDLARSENVAGGFAGIYPVLKAMEQAGTIRRGYFVAGLGGAQFAAPGADDRIRQLANQDERDSSCVVLASTDPANAYGSALPWPATSATGLRPQRSAGSRVILDNGRLIGYLGRSGQHLVTFLPDDEPERGHTVRRLMGALQGLVEHEGPLYLVQVDNQPPAASPLASALIGAGFSPSPRGFLLRSGTRRVTEHA